MGVALEEVQSLQGFQEHVVEDELSKLRLNAAEARMKVLVERFKAASDNTDTSELILKLENEARQYELQLEAQESLLQTRKLDNLMEEDTIEES